jgi:hypothetical protein
MFGDTIYITLIWILCYKCDDIWECFLYSDASTTGYGGLSLDNVVVKGMVFGQMRTIWNSSNLTHVIAVFLSFITESTGKNHK